MSQDILKRITSVMELKPGNMYWVIIDGATTEDINEVVTALGKYKDFEFIVSSERFVVTELDKTKDYSVAIDGGTPDDIKEIQEVLDKKYTDPKFTVSAEKR